MKSMEVGIVYYPCKTKVPYHINMIDKLGVWQTDLIPAALYGKNLNYMYYETFKVDQLRLND